jgi:hypothetical protein
MSNVAYFSCDSPLGLTVNESVAALEGDIRAKEASLLSALDENPRWAGSQGVISQVALTGESFGPVFCKGVLPELDGAKPWCFAFRNCHPRRGPSATPTPLAACLLHSLSTDVFVVAFPAKPLLALGITFGTVDAFFGQANGKQFLEKHAVVVFMSPNEYLYVPSGHMVHVTSFQDVARRAVPDTSTILHIPLGGEFHDASQLEDATKQATVQWNTETFTAKSGQSMWRNRAEWFSKVFS